MFTIIHKGSILCHPTPDSQISITTELHDGITWLTTAQISTLLEQTEQDIRLHIEKLYQEGELNAISTMRNPNLYAFDIAIAIAYRIKSPRSIQFRSWVNKTISAQLMQTATPSPTDEATALQRVLTDYAYALDVLDQYDHQCLQLTGTTLNNLFHITYPAAMEAIHGLKDKFGGSSLFGNEKDDSFRSSLAVIYQTFDGRELYPGVEEKAAHLLYFVVKNHSFSDGNKRIAAFLFVWFMGRNNLLYRENGSKRIADNALVAMTLMIAESKADEMDMMIKVVVNLINTLN